MRGAVARELGDARGRALAHLEVALAGELLVGGDDGAARDAELCRQGPRRRHGVAGAEHTAEDAAAHALDELHADGCAGGSVEHEQWAVHVPPAGTSDRELDWSFVRELDCSHDQCTATLVL